MFSWLKNGIFRSDFKRDRAEQLLNKIDLERAQWIGVYALLVELCSEDDITFLKKYFGTDVPWDSLVMEGLVTRIVNYKKKQEKEIQ